MKAVRSLGQQAKRALGLTDEKPGPSKRRDEYKAVWNSVSKTETEAMFAVSGHTSEDELANTARGTVAILRECVGVNSTDVILEIGAGVGRVGAELAPICREWIGADVSENMLSHITARLKKHSNVRTVALSGFDLSPITSGTVDVVYCTVVFMHLDEWDRFGYIKEAYRVLKPGGRVFVDNINLTSDAGWALFLAHCAVPPHERPTQISKTSTPAELTTYLNRAGFTNVGTRESDLWVFAFGFKPA